MLGLIGQKGTQILIVSWETLRIFNNSSHFGENEFYGIKSRKKQGINLKAYCNNSGEIIRIRFRRRKSKGFIEELGFMGEESSS